MVCRDLEVYICGLYNSSWIPLASFITESQKEMQAKFMQNSRLNRPIKEVCEVYSIVKGEIHYGLLKYIW